MATETEIGNLIRLKYPFLFRNNSGAFMDKNNRMIRYGLGNISKKVNDFVKSSDLIGFIKVENTAVFTAVEIKKSGWVYKGAGREIAQKRFLDLVIRQGGIATFATEVADVDLAIKKWRENV